MKCVAIIVAFAVVMASAQIDPALKKQMLETLKEIAKTCAEQENATPEDLSQLLAHQLPTTKGGKCIMACVNQHIHVQSPDGKMSMDGVMVTIELFREAAPKVYDSMIVIAKKCFPETESLTDRCEIAGKFAECGFESIKEMGLL